MGIAKNIELDSGVTVGYHHVAATSWNMQLKQVHVVVQSFISHEGQEDGKPAVNSQTFSFDADYHPSIQEIYSAVKNLEKFAGATDA